MRKVLDFEAGFLFVGRDGNLYHAAFRETFHYSVLSPKASPHWSVAFIDVEYGETQYAGWATTKWLDNAQADADAPGMLVDPETSTQKS